MYKKSSTAFRYPTNTLFKDDIKGLFVSTKEPINALSYSLIEGKEAVILGINKVFPTSKLLKREFKTRDLPAIKLVLFDGDSKK